MFQKKQLTDRKVSSGTALKASKILIRAQRNFAYLFGVFLQICTSTIKNIYLCLISKDWDVWHHLVPCLSVKS